VRNAYKILIRKSINYTVWEIFAFLKTDFGEIKCQCVRRIKLARDTSDVQRIW